MRHSLGMNEALILTALEAGDELSVADVAKRLASVDVGRSIDDGSLYLALYRMSRRGMVSTVKRTVTSADKKQREIGHYAITAAGKRAVSQFVREAKAITQLARGTT
jgi:DNA-binding PadR family transcriptional regulator